MAQVGVRQTAGNGRTILSAYLERQPSAGSYTSLYGSQAFAYLRNSTNGHYGSVTCAATIVVGAGDRLRVKAWRESGSGTLAVNDDAASLNVMWSGV